MNGVRRAEGAIAVISHKQWLLLLFRVDMHDYIGIHHRMQLVQMPTQTCCTTVTALLVAYSRLTARYKNTGWAKKYPSTVFSGVSRI